MKHRTIEVRSWFALVIVACWVLAATSVGAQSREASPAADGTPIANTGPRFVIYPKGGQDGDYFTLEAEAGSTNELVVVLANADDEPRILHTFASDVVPVVNGGFGTAPEDAVGTGTVTWLDYPAETFDFGPQDGIERTFTVSVPKDAAPGQYIASLTLETAPLDVEGTDALKQVIQKSIAVFIIVPGPENPEFTLLEPEFIADSVAPRIEIPVENSGNVLVKPAGDLVLTNDAGESIFSAPIMMGSVYAGLTATLSVSVPSTVPDGEYQLSVDLSDEETGTTASLGDVPITVTHEVAAPAQFTLAGSVTPMPDPAKPSFADVQVTISNSGEAAQQSELLLEASRDGEVVETFVLAPSLALPPGDTNVTQRYIPPTGWESGTWTFVITLNLIDPATGSATLAATIDDIPPIVIP